MIRLLGFTTGAALAVGAIVLVLGTPELREGSAGDAAARVLPAADPPVDIAVPNDAVTRVPVPAYPAADIATPADSATNPAPPADVSASVAPRAQAEAPLAGPGESPGAVPPFLARGAPASSVPARPDFGSPASALRDYTEAPTSALAEPTDPAVAGGNARWYAVWNPFRSEIAADGFATRLTAVTGIDYRVTKLKPGAYQVAFAYADDSERATKIAQIETATGLELQEQAP